MFVVMFPGQGSQHEGMMRELYEKYAGARIIFNAVKEATDIDVADLCFNGKEKDLLQTQNTQIALYTANLATWQVLELHLSMQHLQPAAMAGHSVGEYAALVASGVLSIHDGARLVLRRGNLMSDCTQLRPGSMAAVLHMELSALEKLCMDLSFQETIVIANYNCKGQYVVSGDRKAIQAVQEMAPKLGAKKVVPLNVSGAFHSPLMKPAADGMKEIAAAATYFEPKNNCYVYSNVTAEPVKNYHSWPGLLVEQIKSPVYWMQSVENMIRDGSKVFIECGPGDVLSNLMKRIDPEIISLKVNDQRTLEQTLNKLQELA